MKKEKLAWKFLDLENGKIVSNRDRSPWTIGKWRTVAAPTEECKGLNCSLLVDDARSYVKGEVAALVEYGGKVIDSGDKLTCEKMRIKKAWRFTATAWARYEAEKAQAWKKILRTLERIK